MDKTVFYSWQSDEVIPNNVCRSFIETALKKAARAISKDESISIDPRVDRDTCGVAGSPAIPQTILDKIDLCDAFVCDVTIVNPNVKKSRRMPNPNVMFELGYAMKRLGWDRIVMVMNTAYGSMKELPFDLERRRVLGYEVEPNHPNLADVRQDLQYRLEGQLRSILSLPQLLDVEATVPSIKERIKTLSDREDFNRYRKRWRQERSGVDECRHSAKETIQVVKDRFEEASGDLKALGVELKTWEDGTALHLTLSYKFLTTVHAAWTQQWANSVESCGWEIRSVEQPAPSKSSSMNTPLARTTTLAADIIEDKSIVWFTPGKRDEGELSAAQVGERIMSDFMERVETRIYNASISSAG